MRSKVVAAEMARAGGAACVIANGGRAGAIRAAIGGEAIGTRFPARATSASSYKLWLLYGLQTPGRIEVDEGARRALAEDGASLLAVGVSGVHGRFAAGDGVEIVGADGAVVARGISELGHAQLRRVAGQRGGKVAVHRDRLVLIDP
jgi:glutamate 5-kinase